GLFVNESGTVTAKLSREEFYTNQSRQYVEDAFDGSLPKFLTAFTKGKRLTKEEADEIRKMIDEM
ncbi:MAG: BlaI/MecI/CopY family transcriptional regulator, partial [Lachnospiraceae bacterium]|nr:BlaI/MecI/CopY family transcriptional regulator [Lachnospiraceae bacterium]